MPAVRSWSGAHRAFSTWRLDRESLSSLRPHSPHRLPGAFGPFAIVAFAAGLVRAHIGENLARCGQYRRIYALVRVPEIGAHDRPRALEVDLIHRHDDDAAWRSAFH